MTKTFVGAHSLPLHLLLLLTRLRRLGGKPNPDRTWTECFAQLVGTVLSLWDAAELDAAGEDGEVLPKFINLTDASIKMVCSQLPGWDELLWLGGLVNLTSCTDRVAPDKDQRRTAAPKHSEHQHRWP